jgi:branched-subunit amino acid ABC-type transport system permease component
MAHGELMMIGAYATFVTQQAFVAWLSPEVPGLVRFAIGVGLVQPYS